MELKGHEECFCTHCGYTETFNRGDDHRSSLIISRGRRGEYGNGVGWIIALIVAISGSLKAFRSTPLNGVINVSCYVTTSNSFKICYAIAQINSSAWWQSFYRSIGAIIAPIDYSRFLRPIKPPTIPKIKIPTKANTIQKAIRTTITPLNKQYDNRGIFAIKEEGATDPTRIWHTERRMNCEGPTHLALPRQQMEHGMKEHQPYAGTHDLFGTVRHTCFRPGTDWSTTTKWQRQLF